MATAVAQLGREKRQRKGGGGGLNSCPVITPWSLSPQFWNSSCPSDFGELSFNLLHCMLIIQLLIWMIYIHVLLQVTQNYSYIILWCSLLAFTIQKQSTFLWCICIIHLTFAKWRYKYNTTPKPVTIIWQISHHNTLLHMFCCSS